ncbi:hypothetical protein UFOVP1236_10 [uncultured Caudovirales phage]|uniref:Uncharacterized protein n=1 Tax=uncultured Caudovirales phage TaxID=2100421 RepID=A0A6J5R480_9CAUD|nr:hypothetical protein UFOVP1236_10 [uncultured Caudovirales phage]
MAGPCDTCTTGVAAGTARQCQACLIRDTEADAYIDAETCRLQRLALERYYSGCIEGAHFMLLNCLPALERLTSASVDDIAREYDVLFTVKKR